MAELIKLTPEQQLDKSIIDAHILAVKRENGKADAGLKMINPDQLSPFQRARYYEVAAVIAENRNDIIEAVKARAKMDESISDIQRKQENNDRTWALLRSANKGLLSNTPTEGNPALAGWLALAQAYNDNLNQPSLLGQALPSHLGIAYLRMPVSEFL